MIRNAAADRDVGLHRPSAPGTIRAERAVLHALALEGRLGPWSSTTLFDWIGRAVGKPPLVPEAPDQPAERRANGRHMP